MKLHRVQRQQHGDVTTALVTATHILKLASAFSTRSDKKRALGKILGTKYSILHNQFPLDKSFMGFENESFPKLNHCAKNRIK